MVESTKEVSNEVLNSDKSAWVAATATGATGWAIKMELIQGVASTVAVILGCVLTLVLTFKHGFELWRSWRTWRDEINDKADQ